MTELETKRVAVAKDALSQVECGRFRTQTGYFRNHGDHCRGCALGSLMLGMIDLGLAPMPDVNRPAHQSLWHEFRKMWGDGFVTVAGDIERAYEGLHYFQWEQEFPVRRDRLIAILQNIIRNNGTFIPSDIQPIEPSIPAFDLKPQPREPQVAALAAHHAAASPSGAV
ncbi:MAG TPA: hypothetical protein VD994_07560 [Prosthecobacter sp.]|nr:hypothetical protein [Prosthecobacter sp.]